MSSLVRLSEGTRSIQLSELDGVHKFNGRLAGFDQGCGALLNGLTLDVNVLSSGLSLLLGGIVSSDTSAESLTRGGHADVLNSDVEALGDDSSSDALVADDTDGVLVDIENSAGLSVVELVRHATLDGTIGQDIDVISLLVGNKELAEGSNTVLSECS